MFFDKKEFTGDELANANTKSRIRMLCLYQIAGAKKGIVVGTGNKVEDYGVVFSLSMVMVVLTLLLLQTFIRQRYGNWESI